MAAKKIQEFVKGKMNSPSVGSIHFNPNDEQQQPAINISNYRKLSDGCDRDQINDTENCKEQLYSKGDDMEYINQSPSSTKSSPGSKPKWGANITDVKKNINNVMEDAFSAFNTLIKGDLKPGMDVDVGSLRTSKTMGSIDKMQSMDDVLEHGIINKSLDNLCQRTDTPGFLASDNGVSPNIDVDSVDFNWFPTPKKKKSRMVGKDLSKKNMVLPKKFRRSLIENYEFPRTRLSLAKDEKRNEYKIKWWLNIGVVLVLLVSLVMLSIKLFIGFVAGAATCYVLLVYHGVVNYSSQKKFMSVPALRDLQCPVIPHIYENNEEDFDLHASDDSNYSCWVNLLGTYDANTYNINQCQAVHLDLEDRSLRIRKPKKKIAHRAMWKEGNHRGVTFTSEIKIELDDVKLYLIPKGLVHKRLWSKKYPICICFPKVLGEYVSDTVSFSETLNFKSQEIYFFGRTCRDKEELFRRLLNTCSSQPVDYNMWNIVQQYLTRPTDVLEGPKSNSNNKSSEFPGRKLTISGDFEDDNKKVTYRRTNKDDEDDQEPSIEALRWKSENSIPQIAEYVRYMAKFMPSDMFLLTAKVMRLDINYVTCTPELLCINALLGRLFWDFLRGSHWIEVIRNKIQCKLKKIHLPQFMDELTVVDIHFGKEIPLIRKFGRPYLDSRGLWFDADVAYTGGFSMILETKVNLFNLRNQMKKNLLDDEKKTSESSILNNALLEETRENDVDKARSRSHSHSSAVADKTAAFLSSEEDSAESSSYSEDSGDESVKHELLWQDDKQNTATGPTVATAGGGSSKRLIRWVDKIARSPYFIKAADNKYIQRGMEMVSNTKLMLQVELHNISGTLAVNIPPPPSDRIWYGFRPSPVIKLSAKPKVGQKEISISKVTDLIEKKLILEFQRVLVLPNMDDVPIPLLVNGDLDKYISNFQ